MLTFCVLFSHLPFSFNFIRRGDIHNLFTHAFAVERAGLDGQAVAWYDNICAKLYIVYK